MSAPVCIICDKPSFAGLEFCAFHCHRDTLAEVIFAQQREIAGLKAHVEAVADKGTINTLRAGIARRQAEQALADMQAHLAELTSRLTRAAGPS